MARTPLETDVEQFTDADQENTALVEIRQENNTVAAADAVILDAIDVIKAVGRIEMANFYATVSEKALVESYINIKKSKSYKGLPYKKESGEVATVATLQDFCEAFLKKSYRRCEELAANYNLLGADLYEQAEKIGFRQRDYNALKALPADDKILIAQAIEEESLDRALDLMQEMAAKHYREKEASTKELAKLTNSLGDKDLIIKHKTEQLNKKTDQLILLESANRQKVDEVDMPGEVQLMRLQDYSRDLTVKITATLNSEIIKLYKEFNDQPPKYIELAARQAVGLIVTAAYGVAENMGFEPILKPEQADDEPGRAEAKAFEAYMATQNTEYMDESNRADQESAEDWENFEA